MERGLTVSLNALNKISQSSRDRAGGGNVANGIWLAALKGGLWVGISYSATGRRMTAPGTTLKYLIVTSTSGS
jgi:hypothetical protein